MSFDRFLWISVERSSVCVFCRRAALFFGGIETLAGKSHVRKHGVAGKAPPEAPPEARLERLWVLLEEHASLRSRCTGEIHGPANFPSANLPDFCRRFYFNVWFLCFWEREKDYKRERGKEANKQHVVREQRRGEVFAWLGPSHNTEMRFYGIADRSTTN